MKFVIKSSENNSIQFSIQIIFNYTLKSIDNKNLAASEQLNKLNLSNLDKKIINLPQGVKLDINSEAYKNFIETVNKIDELLELRDYEVLGESEFNKSDSESVYRGIILNVVKNIDNLKITGKVENFLRLSMHKETRSSRRNRTSKMLDSANSEEARKLNNGQPLEVGSFESVVVKCSVSDSSKTNIQNKEFYLYSDIVKFVDYILDKWSL